MDRRTHFTSQKKLRKSSSVSVCVLPWRPFQPTLEWKRSLGAKSGWQLPSEPSNDACETLHHDHDCIAWNPNWPQPPACSLRGLSKKVYRLQPLLKVLGLQKKIVIDCLVEAIMRENCDCDLDLDLDRHLKKDRRSRSRS